MLAVRCEKYKEKPLHGKVTAVKASCVLIDWLIGIYSGMWREWRGGRIFVYSDRINNDDIILRGITFTKSNRVCSATVSSLKELY